MGDGSTILFAYRNTCGKNRCYGRILAWSLDSETRFPQIPDFDHSSTYGPFLASSPARCCLKDTVSLIGALELCHSVGFENAWRGVEIFLFPGSLVA